MLTCELVARIGAHCASANIARLTAVQGGITGPSATRTAGVWTLLDSSRPETS